MIAENGDCDNCWNEMMLIEAGEINGFAYSLSQCPNCGHYQMAAALDALEEHRFNVAAPKPWPDGRWVHLEPLGEKRSKSSPVEVLAMGPSEEVIAKTVQGQLNQ